MVLFAQNNQDNYPIPSLLDKSNNTMAAGQPKDGTRHVISALIYGTFFGPEICVSPAESNARSSWTTTTTTPSPPPSPTR